VGRLSAIVKSLRGRRRPPSGPLTTTEQTAADELAATKAQPEADAEQTPTEDGQEEKPAP
jgi:hypothetical protein